MLNLISILNNQSLIGLVQPRIDSENATKSPQLRHNSQLGNSTIDNKGA